MALAAFDLVHGHHFSGGGQVNDGSVTGTTQECETKKKGQSQSTPPRENKRVEDRRFPRSSCFLVPSNFTHSIRRVHRDNIPILRLCTCSCTCGRTKNTHPLVKEEERIAWQAQQQLFVDSGTLKIFIHSGGGLQRKQNEGERKRRRVCEVGEGDRSIDRKHTASEPTFGFSNNIHGEKVMLLSAIDWIQLRSGNHAAPEMAKGVVNPQDTEDILSQH